MLECNPLVSFVIPVYNSINWLGCSLDSVLYQDYRNIEVIVVDDASSDGSYELLKKYESVDCRVKVFRNHTNLGVAKSLNFAISMSSGKYIARMDADDVSYLDRISKQVEYMEKNPDCGVLGTWINRLRKKGDQKIKKFPVLSDDLKLMLFFECCFSHPSVMMRKSVIDTLPYIYDESFSSAQDYELWSRLSWICSFACLPEVLLDYRELPTSVSSLAKKKNEKMTRVNKIINFLFYRSGLGDDLFEFHKKLINKDDRSCLSPEDVDIHLDEVFKIYPLATNKDEIRKAVFKCLSTNAFFGVKYILFLFARRFF